MAARRVQTVVNAARADKRLSILIALRHRIAQDVDNATTSSRDLAALSKRMLEVQNEIDAIRAADGPAPGQGGGGLADAAGAPDEAFPAT
jgi:hypothetical protein